MNILNYDVENVWETCGKAVVIHIDTVYIPMIPGCFMVTIIFMKRSIVTTEGKGINESGNRKRIEGTD